MAWTTPLTAVENVAWTSAQWNTHIRDNFAETAPGKATAAGRYMVTIVERQCDSATVATSQGTTSTTYVDLTTAGPAVTLTTGTRALVIISSALVNSTLGSFATASWAVSGATTLAANDNYAITMNDSLTMTLTAVKFIDTLTAGSNTFTMKYKASANTATFADRRIAVFAF
jgi:hypothetical protein